MLQVRPSEINPKYGLVIVTDAGCIEDQVEELSTAFAFFVGAGLKRTKDKAEVVIPGHPPDLEDKVKRINRMFGYVSTAGVN